MCRRTAIFCRHYTPDIDITIYTLCWYRSQPNCYSADYR